MKRPEIRPIPEGYSTITPMLTVHDAAQMIEFYKEAFGAQERYRMPMPNGKGVAHAEMRIGDSVFMLGDEMPSEECSRSPQSLGGFYIYVKDVDNAFERAVSAGATVKMPVANMFWGDRMGSVKDPSGHIWSLATHVEEVSPEEIEKRGRKAFEETPQPAGRQ